MTSQRSEFGNDLVEFEGKCSHGCAFTIRAIKRGENKYDMNTSFATNHVCGNYHKESDGFWWAD